MSLVYTTKEAAKLLKVDVKTIYKLKDEHQLQCVRAGSKLLIPEIAINNFLGIISQETEKERELEAENRQLREKLTHYEQCVSALKTDLMEA